MSEELLKCYIEASRFIIQNSIFKPEPDGADGSLQRSYFPADHDHSGAIFFYIA